MAEAGDGKEGLRDEALELLAQANLSGERMTTPILLTTVGKVRQAKDRVVCDHSRTRFNCSPKLHRACQSAKEV